jgi:hypothetical protein
MEGMRDGQRNEILFMGSSSPNIFELISDGSIIAF